jgi:hypothetical protein
MTWATLRFYPLQLVFQALPSASDNPLAFFSVLQCTPHPKLEPVQLLLVVAGKRNRRARILVYHFRIWRMVALAVFCFLPAILKRIATSLFLTRCTHIEARRTQR